MNWDQYLAERSALVKSLGYNDRIEVLREINKALRTGAQPRTPWVWAWIFRPVINSINLAPSYRGAVSAELYRELLGEEMPGQANFITRSEYMNLSKTFSEGLTLAIGLSSQANPTIYLNGESLIRFDGGNMFVNAELLNMNKIPMKFEPNGDEE